MLDSPPHTLVSHTPPTNPSAYRLVTSAAQKNVLLPIFERLSLPSILTLMGTSVNIRAELQACVRIAFHQLLKSFGLDPGPFRALMRTYGAVTFSDDALQFMTRSWAEDSPPGRLSLLVPSTYGEDGFVTLLRKAGYSEEARTVTGDEFLPLGVARIRNLVRCGEETKSTPRIRLFITFPGPRFIQALTHLPTSAHLSYITADSIHVFLPSLTLAKRAVVVARGFTEDEDADLSLDKLTQWCQKKEIHHLKDHYKLDVRTTYGWDSEPCGAACGIVMQSFKSKNVLRLKFDDDGLSSSPWYTSGDGFQGNNVHFQLRGRCYNQHCPNYLDYSYVPLALIVR